MRSAGLSLIEELAGGFEEGACTAEPNPELIDRDDEHAAVRRLQVGGEQRFERIGRLTLRGFHVDSNVVGGDDAARLAVDLHHEVRREQILDRLAVAVDDRHVDRNDVDPGSESRALRRLV